MKLAFCSVCLHKHPFEQMLSIASHAGYRDLELIAIPTWIHVDLNKMSPNELEKAVSAHGMKLIALYPGGVDTQSDETIAKSLNYIQRAISTASELGVSRIVFTGSHREEPLDAAIKAYRTLVPYLQAANVTLCLENHYNNQIEFPEDYEAIFKAIDSPNVGMTVDTGHFTSSQVDIPALIDRFADRVRHVHLKDHIGTQSVMIGKGRTDNPGILRRLHQKGYTGYISLELEVADYENSEAYIAEAKSLIEGYIAKAEG